MRPTHSFGHAALLAAALSMAFAANIAPAHSEAKEKLTKKGWAACSTKFSKTAPKPLRLDESGNFICPKGQKPITRHQAYNACRDQLDPMSFMIMKTNRGWLCRYFGP